MVLIYPFTLQGGSDFGQTQYSFYESPTGFLFISLYSCLRALPGVTTIEALRASYSHAALVSASLRLCVKDFSYICRLCPRDSSLHFTPLGMTDDLNMKIQKTMKKNK